MFSGDVKLLSYKSFCCSSGLNKFRTIFQRPLIMPLSTWKEKEAVDGVKKRDKSSLWPNPKIFTMHMGWLCELDAENYRDVMLQSYNGDSCTFKAVSDYAFVYFLSM